MNNIQNSENYGLSVKQNPSIDMEETLLVNRSSAGDNYAFEQLYRINVNRIYAICLRISANKDKAEELTQDVFVKAWERINSFRGESLFSTWLYRIAVNTSLIEIRRQNRWINRFKYFSEKLEFRNTAFEESFKNIDLENAIYQLPDKARIVFILHDIEGYKHDEIAELLSIKTGTTKAQLHRARKLLREALNK